MLAERKTSFKLPPTTIRDRLVSQQSRREQVPSSSHHSTLTPTLSSRPSKIRNSSVVSHSLSPHNRSSPPATFVQRRAQRFDSARHLDQFADLSLGHSDDDEDDAEDGDVTGPTTLTPASVAPYASMVEPYQPPNAISGTLKPSAPQPVEKSMDATTASPTRSKNRKRNKKKGKNKKPSKWADKCMYAELLEMSEDDPWSDVDGLPQDLETGWVAVAPVPVGKRCLAVTHQSSGVSGIGESFERIYDCHWWHL